MSTAMDRIIDVYTTVVLVGLVLLAPYTKVEESFNVQAVHDFLYHGTDLQAYDHVEFPGVVPRTFLGSLVLAVSSWPTVRLIDLTMGHLQDNRILSLYVVRGTMAVIAAAALRRLRNACPASSKPALPVIITLCITGCFHLSFYYTRLLPNSFGLILSTYSLALYIERKTLTAMQ
ncbi:dolichyl-P-Man:Man(7)GlcNAc(2)-PP-dolichol alpha-1,6-mannosyltransferase, partial [Perkinsus olseni]